MDEVNDVFPFPALVGQEELKLALLLALVNPAVGGVLLQGPYGVGKTTAVRALLDLMPPALQPVCAQGCDEAEPEAQCAECREQVSRGEPLTREQPVRLIELPLTARMEDVVGGIDERVAMEQRRVLLEPGILRTADRNVLYVDEINLLEPRIADAILDAAAQGRTFVRRGAMIRLFPSRFVLIGSMNPEEGRLRPQILDRFGLRVWVTPLQGADRLQAVRNARAFRENPRAFRAQYAARISGLTRVVAQAREALSTVGVPAAIEEAAVTLVETLEIPSHRAEHVLLEAARAHAALATRATVEHGDMLAVAGLTLRNRRSSTLDAEQRRVAAEDTAIAEGVRSLRSDAETEETAVRRSAIPRTPNF